MAKGRCAMESMGEVTNDKFWKNKKVLVTGHEGFLGSWLSKVLIEKGARMIGIDKVKNRSSSVLNGLRKKITCIQGDIAESLIVKQIIARYKPEIIFHLAAEAIVNNAVDNPIKTFKSNIEGTWNVLDGARGKEYIEAIIVASSDKAYGSHNILPYREDAALKGSHPYDASKSCADILCHAYHNTYKIPVCVTRCGNIYGPGDHHFSRIVPDAVRCAVSNRMLLIRSNGKFTRDYIYIEDIVNGYLLIAENMKKLKLEGEAFNLSNDDPITVIGLVKKIFKAANTACNYKIMDKAKFEIRHQYLSSKKARRLLRWKPMYDLDEGIRKTIEWYRKRAAV